MCEKYSDLCDDDEYSNALARDVVGLARTLVSKCRASDGRRKELRLIIVEGNTNGGWGEESQPVALLQLLKDVDTRWSSTFLMIDRLLELNLVCSFSLLCL